jgi:hypothetical protein
VDVEDSLVDSHLPSIVRVRSLTARRFAHNKLEEFGRHADGSADLQVLAESLVLELKAYFLEGFDFSRGEGDTDSMDFDLLGFDGLAFKVACKFRNGFCG